MCMEEYELREAVCTILCIEHLPPKAHVDIQLPLQQYYKVGPVSIW